MGRRRSNVGRIIRSLVGLDVYARPQIRPPMLTLGAGDGTWRVVADAVPSGALVYSFGIGRDLRFELDLIERFDAKVEAFDPTPIALEWVASQDLPPQLRVHPFGVADEDGIVRFAAPSKRGWESFSMVREKGEGESVDAPVRRMSTLMAQLGHRDVDLVKMDIEGAEYAVLPDLVASGIRPRQVLVEFHHRWREVGAGRTRAMIRLLQRNGYRIADVSPKGRELTFLRA